MTYTVQLKTVDGREVRMCVLNGKVVDSHTYNDAMILRRGDFPFDMRYTWIKADPFRPLRQELEDALVVSEVAKP